MAPSPAEARLEYSEARSPTVPGLGVGDAQGDLPPEPHRPRRLKVWRVMRPVPDGVAPESTVTEAEERMDERGVNWLPVLDHGRCVGILTRQDIRSALRRRPRRGRATLLSVGVL